MLRSLVGSEMCIRDSPGTFLCTMDSPTFRLLFMAAYTMAELAIYCAPFNTCLLYTSDAADDLLCVDLGGRRIIKKKKKNNNTSYFKKY